MPSPIHLSYSSFVRKFSNRHPLLNNIFTHILFWGIAFVLLSIIIFLSRHSIIRSFSLPVNLELEPYVLNSAITGFFYGTGMGVMGYYFEKKIFRNKPLGLILVFKFILAVLLLLFVFIFRRYVLFPLFVAPTLNETIHMNSNVIWDDLFYIMLIYAGAMSIVFNFMSQVNKKFGPGILLPLLLGKYRNPHEEERIFMFMDLKSSTTIAEELGHLKYSAFIRDAFMDINAILADYNADVYQYVGDEIVLSWKTEEGLKNHACVHFFFACGKQFESRSGYYMKHYGTLPYFKASIHVGKVTAVEIGDIKRDIAYHGDTLNTAARIQSMCNQYEKQLLVSDIFSTTAKLSDKFQTTYHGNIVLKGKTNAVGIISIDAQ